jgi:thioredoxin-related protein
VIEDIYLNHPEIRIEAFAKGFSDRELEEYRFPARQDNGMGSLFKVNSYPAIAVFNKKKQKYLLSGYIDENEILKLFK